MADEESAQRRPAARCRRWPRTSPGQRRGERRDARSPPRPWRARYFEAIDARDLERRVALWAEGGRENVRGQVDVAAPEGVRAFIGELLGALPGPALARSSRPPPRATAAGVQWRLTGTFAGPGALRAASAATGDPSRLEGFDLLTVRDGADPVQRRVHRLASRFAAPDRDDAPAGLDRRTADDGRLQRQDAPDRAAVRRRGRARGRGRVGRAGPAGALQRVPDRGRGRRDAVRRRARAR